MIPYFLKKILAGDINSLNLLVYYFFCKLNLVIFQALLLSTYVDSMYLVRVTPLMNFTFSDDSLFLKKNLGGGHKFSEFACCNSNLLGVCFKCGIRKIRKIKMINLKLFADSELYLSFESELYRLAGKYYLL